MTAVVKFGFENILRNFVVSYYFGYLDAGIAKKKRKKRHL